MGKKAWYALRVQSEREEKIKENLVARIRAKGLDKYVAQIVVPAENVSEIREAGRSTQGVRLINLGENEALAGLEKIVEPEDVNGEAGNGGTPVNDSPNGEEPENGTPGDAGV